VLRLFSHRRLAGSCSFPLERLFRHHYCTSVLVPLSSEEGGMPLPLKSRELAFHHFCVRISLVSSPGRLSHLNSPSSGGHLL
jgi:hypothetical protein